MQVDIGKGLLVNVDTSALAKHAEVFEHIVYIGLRNVLMDCHASITKEEYPDETARKEASLALAMKKLQTMYDGLVRTKVASVAVSALERMMIRVFIAKLPKAKRVELAKLDDKGKAWIDLAIEKNRAKVEEWAKAEIAKQEAEAIANEKLAKELELDLDI